jgi:hypothetical protein
MNVYCHHRQFQTVADVVIVNSIHIDLVRCVLMIVAHVTTIVAKDKTRSYTNQALGDDFIFLAIEAYGCLHPRFDSFFDFLCTCQYSLSLANLLGTFDAYISL